MRRIIDKKIENIMTKDVITVRKNTTLHELKELWDKYDFNVFPVIDDKTGKLVGVVTKLSFLKIFAFDSDRLIPDLKSIFAKNAGDIMSKRIIGICSNDSIKKAAQIMMSNRVRSLIVTDEKKEILKGIVTRGDIMKYVEVD